MQKVDLLEGSIVRSLTSLALPIMATSLIQMAYNMTDMIWIGRVSANAVAAVGAAALWLGERTLLLLCAVWGVFGLFQAAHTLNGVIARLALGRVPWWHCLAAALEIVLALELIFTSGEAIVLHVRLLGLQLLSAAFSYRRRETFTLE